MIPIIVNLVSWFNIFKSKQYFTVFFVESVSESKSQLTESDADFSTDLNDKPPQLKSPEHTEQLPSNEETPDEVRMEILSQFHAIFCIGLKMMTWMYR